MRYTIIFLVLSILIAGCVPQSAEKSLQEAFESEAVLKISSPAFGNNGMIPLEYTCDDEDVNPPLMIDGLPPETVSLALIVDDPDAPSGTWNHWVMWNINPVSIIDRDTSPGIQGTNDFKKTSYSGPCPPSGTHRYFFRIYALDTELDLEPGASKKELEDAMKGRILATGEFIGTYKKSWL